MAPTLAEAALSALCAAHWDPVFRLHRGSGTAEGVAREQAQEFFAKVLAGEGFPGADPARGRFREYLIGAMAVLSRAMSAVEKDLTGSGKSPQFAALRPWLAGTPDSDARARVRSELGLSDGALKVAVHRFRRRFREAVRAEIRQPLPDGGQVDDEWRYLVEVPGIRDSGSPIPDWGDSRQTAKAPRRQTRISRIRRFHQFSQSCS